MVACNYSLPRLSILDGWGLPLRFLVKGFLWVRKLGPGFVCLYVFKLSMNRSSAPENRSWMLPRSSWDYAAVIALGKMSLFGTIYQINKTVDCETQEKICLIGLPFTMHMQSRLWLPGRHFRCACVPEYQSDLKFERNASLERLVASDSGRQLYKLGQKLMM